MSMTYRMQHNPELTIKPDQMSADQLNDLQNNLLDKADKLLADIKFIGNAVMEKWVEM